jgi:hypothetical protein
VREDVKWNVDRSSPADKIRDFIRRMRYNFCVLADWPDISAWCLDWVTVKPICRTIRADIKHVHALEDAHSLMKPLLKSEPYWNYGTHVFKGTCRMSSLPSQVA